MNPDTMLTINEFDDINLALSAAFESENQTLLLVDTQLGENFFNLRTRLAGELFQKLTNYGVKAGIVIKADHPLNERFVELMRDHTSHSHIRFFETESDAKHWLKPQQHG